jgi:hypothetical protein
MFLTNQSISLPFGFSQALEVCRDYLAKQAFVVLQCGEGKRLIGLRKEDSTRVVIQFDCVSDIRTEVSISEVPNAREIA